MKTNFFVRSKSIYDKAEYREISLQKICETFGLDMRTFEFVCQSGKEEISVKPTDEYGISIDSSVKNERGKDLYALADVEFSCADEEDRDPGFVTYVHPGLWSVEEDNEEHSCETDGVVVIVNQHKRATDDDSRKVGYFDSDYIDMVDVAHSNNIKAATAAELKAELKSITLP